jgi:hypothetical protein
MPLRANAKLPIRTGPNFGYTVPAGIHVYAGSMLAIDANSNVQPIQAGTELTYAGVSDRELDNSASGVTSTSFVVAQRDIVARVPVAPAAGGTLTALNLGAPVYAIDDASCSLGSTTIVGGATLPLLEVGTLCGLENGTWVRFNR